MVRRAAGTAGWAVCLALLVAIWPTQFGGWASYTIVSGTSMEPLYHTGDLVVGWHHRSYAPGDIVVFTVPEGEPGAGYQVIHRLVSHDAGVWTTRGDNKRSVDPWSPTDDDIVGAAVVHIPNGGYALMWMPIALALLAGVLVAVALWPQRAKGRRRTGMPPDVGGGGAAGGGPTDRRGMSSMTVAMLVAVIVGLAWPAASFIGGNAATLGGLEVRSIDAWTLIGAQLELPGAPDSTPHGADEELSGTSD